MTGAASTLLLGQNRESAYTNVSLRLVFRLYQVTGAASSLLVVQNRGSAYTNVSFRLVF